MPLLEKKECKNGRNIKNNQKINNYDSKNYSKFD